MRFGMNDLGGNISVLLQEYPPGAWITFDGARARELANLFPDALVIYRHMQGGGDNNIHVRRPDARLWYREARAACAWDNRIIIQCGNEPDADPTQLPALAAWTNTILNEADLDGGTVAVLGFAVCHPDPNAWRGELLPVLRALSDSRHYLLLHEYFLFHGKSKDCIGAFKHVYEACDDNGVSRPAIIIGEYGYDLPGWKVSQRERQLRDEDYVAQLAHAWNTIYAPAGIRAACVFSWGKGDSWQDYDVSDAGAFMTALKSTPLADPVLPAPGQLSPDTADLTAQLKAIEERLEQLETELRQHTQIVAEQQAALRAIIQQLASVF